MIQGEFIRTLKDGSEHVVPNQFTIYGIQMILRSAFWSQQPAMLWVGLCAHNPADMIALANVQEPEIGTNGYARQTLPMGQVNWPNMGLVNGESYIETREFTFELTDDTTVPVNRFFLTDGTYVIAISSAFEHGLDFYDEPISNRYRLYFR